MSKSILGDGQIGDFPLDELPDDVIVVILSFCSIEFLMKRACLVSKKWRDFIDSQTLWKLKCIQQGVAIPPGLPMQYRDYQLLCLKNAFGRNLLRNWDASEEFSFWRCYYNRKRRALHAATGIKVEESTWKESNGCQALSELNIGTTRCWATSCIMVTLSQKVDLIDQGLTPAILDHIQPVIHVSVWIAARFDCASHYVIEVSLLGEKGQMLREGLKFTKTRDVPQYGDSSWVKIGHSFRNYGRGVRIVKFVHGGMDTQFRVGNYGPKMAAPSVRVEIEGKLKN